jgi:chromate reductase
MDIDGESKPEPVKQFMDSIADCDGVLFSTPEYNYSIPGLLKNAIDWASRPAYKSVMAGKPVAILSASVSPVGGARVQAHLRDILSATLSPVVPSPPFLLPQIQNKFDKEGELTDSASLQRLERYMEEFVDWVARLA